MKWSAVIFGYVRVLAETLLFKSVAYIFFAVSLILRLTTFPVIFHMLSVNSGLT
jgi:hypothetical protein